MKTVHEILAEIDYHVDRVKNDIKDKGTLYGARNLIVQTLTDLKQFILSSDSLGQVPIKLSLEELEIIYPNLKCEHEWHEWMFNHKRYDQCKKCGVTR